MTNQQSRKERLAAQNAYVVADQQQWQVQANAPTTNPTSPTETPPDWLGTPQKKNSSVTPPPQQQATMTSKDFVWTPKKKTPPSSGPIETDPATPPTPAAAPQQNAMTYEDNVKKRATELQAEGKTKEQIAAQLDIETNLWNFWQAPARQAPQPNKNLIKDVAQRNAVEVWITADTMVDSLMAGIDNQRGTPEYEVAKKRAKDIQVLATMPAWQIANSILTNQILPGSQKLLDLQKYYPNLALQVQDEYVKQSQLWMINEFGAGLYSTMPKSDTVDTKWYEWLATMKSANQKSDTPEYFDALAWTVREQFSQSMGEDAQEMLGFVEAQLNDPKIIAQKEKVIALNDKKTEIELLIKGTEKAVRGEISSEAPEAFVSAYIQEMTGDLYDKLDSVNRSLFTEQSILTAYTDTANQNIQTYQVAKQMDMDQKQAEAEAAAAERELQYKAMMDQANLEMDYARMAMDQEQNMFDRQKFYTQMWFDEQKFQRDQQRYMNDQQRDAYKFQTEMDQTELDRYYNVMMDEKAPLQMKTDIYDYLFNGVKPWLAPTLNVGEQPTMDVSSWYLKNIGYGKITSFGGTHDNYQGIDIDGEIGDPIPSPGGTVVEVWSWNWIKGQGGKYGNYVDIKDDQWYVHRYAHLDQINVKKWDVVGKGKVFGTIWNTGYVIAGPGNNGSHLDYSIKKPWGGFMKSKEALQYIQAREWAWGGFEITPAKPNLSPVKSKGILAGMQWIQEVDPNLSPVKWATDVFNLRNPSMQTSSFVFPQPELPYNPFRQQQQQQSQQTSTDSDYGKKAAILSYAKKLFEKWSIEPKDVVASGITMEEFNREAPKLYIENKAAEAKVNNFKVVNKDLLFGNEPGDYKMITESMQTANDLLQSMKEYKSLVKKYGTESRPTEAKGKLKTLHSHITLWLKEKAAGYNLWVLNGKDWEILTSNFPEATKKRFDPTPALPQMYAQIDTAIKSMTNRVQNKAKSLWFEYQPWYANASAENPRGLDLETQ